GGQLSTSLSVCPQNSECVLQKGPGTVDKFSTASLVATGVSMVPASLHSVFHINKYKDFIRCLPAHLSKYILGLLDRKSLSTCVAVSKCWAFLAKEVKREHASQKITQEEIVCLQGSCPRGVVSNYAKIVNVMIPRLNKDGNIIQVKDQKWTSKLKEDEEDSLQLAYHGLKTDTIQLEERNVFCGSYNIRVLTDQLDPNRVIHYSGGNLVAVGSADRKVRFLGVLEMKEVLPLLSGHAGSIKALYLNEKEGFVLSASFDLSIRCWDIYSGVCTKIFNGHSGTITCLDLFKDKFVSGAKDGMVKVWDLESRKCLRTLKHNNSICVVKMNGTHVVSGCDKGLVKVWYVESGTLIKVLEGHQGPVKCLSFDQWHLVTGSTDGYALAWSMVGNYKRCLTAFRHPKAVLFLEFLYLRVISGCADGKIRIFNYLTGSCLKVMRANSRGDPISSFCVAENRMVINALSCLLMFQFEDVQWNYNVKTDREMPGKKKEQHKALTSKTPVLRMKRGKNMLKSKTSFNIQEQKNLFIPDNQKPHMIGLEKSYSARTVPGTGKNSLKPGLTVILKMSAPKINELIKEKAMISTRESKAHSGRKVCSRTEATLQHKKKSCPLFPYRILLTVRALQSGCKSPPGSSWMRRVPAVAEAGEPPRRQQEHPEKMQISKTPQQHREDQTAELQRMRSNSDSLTMKRISTPFESKRLRLKLINSLHGPLVKSSIPAPSIIRPKSYCGALEEKKAPRGSGKVTALPEAGVQLIGHFTTSSDPIKSTPMVVQVKMESVSRKKKPFLQYTADPYRVNSGFRLLTRKQQAAYEEATTVQYRANQTKLIEDQQRECKKAWSRKIKGLPISSFTKEGKIAAPELGLNTFI
ncbi:FBW10 protein, partial [Nothocercus nigrocapillus]|nr:FBW10 protein [Nothocercus nigrocapillus]